ncbi:MAG TPA: hypothetical protein VF062_00815 [Candidatus Limnocylindrales bacterium]
MHPKHRAAVASFLALSMVLAGCDPADRSGDGPEARPPVEPAWRSVTLPMPEGPPGRLMLREAVACGGTWYVLGAIGAPNGDTRPAVWTSTDTETWRTVGLRPHPRSYYGERSIIYSGACKDGKLAVLGAKVGGAHGNPRASTWMQLPDGTLEEVLAEFELYGGPQAINVSRMAAGPNGWIMSGNRFSGAAVWLSPDAAAFKIMERTPELASDQRGETWSTDTTATAAGWLVVGGVLAKGRIDRDPMAWLSTDGATWRRTSAPSSSEYEEFHRVAVVEDSVLAIGLRGPRFGAWRLDGDKWTETGTFGSFEQAGIPSVADVAVNGKNLLVAISMGTIHQLLISPDGRSFIPVKVPAAMPSGAEKAVALATSSQRILLLIDDGAAGRLWATDLSVTF